MAELLNIKMIWKLFSYLRYNRRSMMLEILTLLKVIGFVFLLIFLIFVTILIINYFMSLKKYLSEIDKKLEVLINNKK